MSNYSFDSKELRDLGLTAIALGFVFSFFTNFSSKFIEFLSLTIILMLSFFPHEMAHKFVAIKYGYYAKFEMWTSGLLFALFLAVVTNGNFVFAAPGAVVIYQHVHQHKGKKTLTKENGIISMAGPLTNLTIALVGLFLISFLTLSQMIVSFLGSVVFVNSLLALFNLIPVPPLDGSKIIWWNISIWLGMFVISGLLVFFV